MKNITVRQTVIAAMLTALSLIIATLHLGIPLPQPFSVTFAAHVPTIIAMFISPWVAICTVIGSTIGFLSIGPIVALRAASHILFVICGVYMLKRKWNPYLVLILTALLHGLGEAVISLVFSPMLGINIAAMKVDFAFIPFIANTFGPAVDYLVNTVFIMTVLHHLFDSVISIMVLLPLERAGYIPHTRLFPAKKLYKADTKPTTQA